MHLRQARAQVSYLEHIQVFPIRGRNPLIGKLIDAFSPQECANYFKAAGYDPE